MKIKHLLLTTSLIAFLGFLAVSAFAKDAPLAAAFPAGIHHEAWDALLKKYVSERGLVGYEKWKANAADLKALNEYLAQYAAKSDKVAKGNDLAASGVNAYNAFAIQWILENYPTESVMALPKSFDRKAHLVGGQKVSLDDIEHGTVVPLIGYRAHAVLVCCARSCPPLQRTAYTAGNFDAQDDTAYAVWLAREDLNKYEPEKNHVAISSIFKWFKDDFDAAGGVPKILGQHAPSPVRAFLAKGGYKLDYLPYRWGLNDQGAHGTDYSTSNLIFDKLTK